MIKIPGYLPGDETQFLIVWQKCSIFSEFVSSAFQTKITVGLK